MFKKSFFIFIAFYFFILLETSFLASFTIFGFTLDLIFISVIAINLFEKTEGRLGYLCAFVGGFFLDVFSSNFFGLNTAILLVSAVFIKKIIRQYVSLPTFKRI
jgi:rod shape-determining protein MreD